MRQAEFKAMIIQTGLAGRSILASRSPWLHEQEARAQGLPLTYTLFDFNALGHEDSELGPLLHRLAESGYSGLNITFPFKQAVIPLLDELAECAATVGAVNTVAMRGGRLTGYNTDKTGFQQSLIENLPGAALDHVLQLGAGGAGAAVAHALLSAGVKHLTIADLDPVRAGTLADALRASYGAERIAACSLDALETATVDGIVNTTPMGMTARPGMAIAADLIDPRHWVADIVYFPIETQLLRTAQEKGCRVMNGSGMVVGQAAEAFGIFTGKPADKARMAASFAKT